MGAEISIELKVPAKGLRELAARIRRINEELERKIGPITRKVMAAQAFKRSYPELYARLNETSREKGEIRS